MSKLLQDRQKKVEKAKLLQQKLDSRNGLPHLHMHKLYAWQRSYLDACSLSDYMKSGFLRMKLLTSANQVGKSSIAIIDNIEKAGNPKLWPLFWNRKPRSFLYLYPNNDKIREEFETKWRPLLPQNGFDEHSTYGWNILYSKGIPKELIFNSGVSIWFKSHHMDLQSNTYWLATADEELPKKIYDEVQMRLSATLGIFASVFTPTLSQPFWFEAMECIDTPKERFRGAWKRSVSLYDCVEYEDGTPSAWTLSRIRQRGNSMSDQSEVLRRIHGRFIMSQSGKAYSSFNMDKNVKPPISIPKDWMWYCGVDLGSGGDKGGHPSAITFVAVRPDMCYARITRAWRGDGIVTTSTDVLRQFLQMKRECGIEDFTGQYYDFSSADFYNTALRANVPFEPADKGRESGKNLLNALFKNGMLDIDDTEENKGLIDELMSLKVDADKKHARDDSIDSARYAVVKIPFDFTHISGDFLLEPLEERKIVDPREEAAERALKPFNADDWNSEREIQEYISLLEV